MSCLSARTPTTKPSWWGTFALLKARGVGTHVVCATDGQGGETGGLPEITTREMLATVRRQELRCAGNALGLDSVTLLGYEDPVVGPDETLFSFQADENTLVAQIVAQIRLIGADVVLSHGSNGEYGHPAHVQVHQATRRAVEQHAPDAVFYGVAALVPAVEDRLWNRDDPAHLALDITPWIERKHAAMLCHRTQHALFMRRRALQTVQQATRDRGVSPLLAAGSRRGTAGRSLRPTAARRRSAARRGVGRLTTRLHYAGCLSVHPPILPTCGRLSFPHKEGRNGNRQTPLPLFWGGGRGRGMGGFIWCTGITPHSSPLETRA